MDCLQRIADIDDEGMGIGRHSYPSPVTLHFERRHVILLQHGYGTDVGVLADPHGQVGLRARRVIDDVCAEPRLPPAHLAEDEIGWLPDLLRKDGHQLQSQGIHCLPVLVDHGPETHKISRPNQ